MADDQTACDFVAMVPCRTSAVDGYYYVLNPNNAMVIAAGPMTENMYEELHTMTNDTFSIVEATPEHVRGTLVTVESPFEIISTPTPTPR